MLNIKPAKHISMQDWNETVEATYGRIYNLQQQDGCMARGLVEITVPNPDAALEYDYENDSVPEEVNGDEMGVSFAAWLARDPNQPLDSEDEWDRNHGLSLFWKRNFYPSLDMVANDLYEKGLIPAGEYTIVIDW